MTAHDLSVGRRVPRMTANPQRAEEHRMGKRIVRGVAIAVPTLATFFALVVLFALRGRGAPVVPGMLTGAVVGALAGCFAGFWVGTVISGPDFEE